MQFVGVMMNDKSNEIHAGVDCRDRGAVGCAAVLDVRVRQIRGSDEQIHRIIP